MPTRPCALSVLALLLSGASFASAAKLDKDDKQWLEAVDPILLEDEEKTFKKLDEKADRLAFREIFWARRDPDLATSDNEFKAEYEEAREAADNKFRIIGRPGSLTDCGRVFLLLGEPDDIEQQGGLIQSGLRVPEAWFYRDRPGRTFEGGEAVLAFDEECRCRAGIDKVLEQFAMAKVVQPQLVYRVGDDGRLVTLEAQLPKDSPARALLRSPRQDFPIAIDTSFMKVSQGVSGVLGVLRGEIADAEIETRNGEKVVDVTVTTGAVRADGEELGWTEQLMAADVQPDGSFLVSYGMAMPPGDYTLNVGVLVGEQGAVVSESIEVPDFSKVETAEDGTETTVPTVASILFVRDIEDLPPGTEPDPAHPYAAFRLGLTQLSPHFGRELKQSDTVSFFYLVYDLQVDPATDTADAVVAFALLKDGRTPVAQAPESPIATPIAASSIGPVPLAAYEPGKYVVQLRVTDHLSKKTVVRNERFTITGPEAEAR